MAHRADEFDLAGLRLSAGEGRRMTLDVALEPFELGGQPYEAAPAHAAVTLDVSRTTGGGYALRIAFQARVVGPCMRCLGAAEPLFEVEAREVSQPGAGEELQSPYVRDGVLDIGAWARDALALTLPAQILCRVDCAGLCAICGADLNKAGPEHRHERAPDPRWSKLSELKFDL